METDLKSLNYDLLTEVLKQIEKDLSLAGFPIVINQDDFNDFFQLRSLVKDKLTMQLNRKLTEIKRILYHLDLSNDYFKEFISKPDGENFLFLAEVIIKKALMKVVVRKKFSGI